MTKKDFVKLVAEDAGVSQAVAGKLLDSIFINIKKTLLGGNTLKIHNFGVFKTTERAARSGRNPQTGAPLEIPAKRVPVFRASPVLKTVIAD